MKPTLGYLLASLLLTGAAFAQTTGWNALENSAGIVAASESIIDATQFTATSGDVCTQINQALNKLPALGGTVDARGLTGTLTCKSNPWNGYTGTSIVLLGAATYQTNSPWTIPNMSKLVGVGRGGSGVDNTSIQWTGTPGTGNIPLIAMGASNPSFGVSVSDLTVDCANSQHLIGIQNENSQELSEVNNVTIVNCTVYGLDVEGTGSQNSGPYTNIVVSQTTSNGCFSTIPVKYADSGKRGINGLTITEDACSTAPAVGVDVNANGGYLADTISNVHCENVTTCILIGDLSKTNAITVSDVVGCPSAAPCTNVVKISNAYSGTGDILLTDLRLNSGTTNLVDDQVGGNTALTDSYLGFYTVGHGTNAPVISSSLNINAQQIPQHMGLSSPDSAGGCTLTSGTCTVSFSKPYIGAPICTANFTGTSTAGLQVNTYTTKLVINAASGASGTANYICVGNPN